MKKSKLLIGLGVAGVISAGLGSSVGPASAEPHTLLITLAGGSTVTITVDIPPGTPVSSISLPTLALPIVSIQDLTPSAPPTTTAPTTSAPTEPPKATGSPQQQGTTNTTTTTGTTKPGKKPRQRIGSTTVQDLAPQREQQAAKSRTPDGIPTAANPTFSLAQFGPAKIGVPDFFIEKFRIPPFLLPIYQAAGIEYGIPWQILAAINEIETDYGRNLNVSSAGALGWMQFIPSSWRAYGVDANGDGRKDPYNPVDAIFAAGRYLKAAGGDRNIRNAIFSYNHANWYVDSVMLRAKLIGGLPSDLISSITGLTEGRFPVAASAKYADDVTDAQLAKRASKGNPSVTVQGSPTSKGINVFAKAGSPVIAVNDGVVKQVGDNTARGKFVVLEDVYGNSYTYSHLGEVAPSYPTPKPKAVSAAQIKAELSLPKDPKPTAAASAGGQPAAAASGPAATDSVAAGAAVAKERLFAHPARTAAYAAGGAEQMLGAGKPVAGYETFQAYFKQVLGLDSQDVVLRKLVPGSQVIAGTILGRLDKTDSTMAPHLRFEIKPAGKGSPLIDPKPILDGWKLLDSTAIYRAEGTNPFFGPNAKNATIGQILLMSKEQLEKRVLADPNIEIYECGRRDIASGQIDRRVLATMEFLAQSGMKPTISALKCGHSYLTKAGGVSEHSSGNAVDVAAINGIPIIGHQGAGSITDIAVRRLLTLQGTMKPHQIITLYQYPGTDNTLALSDHNDHIHIGFYPQYSSDPKLAQAYNAVLKPAQWIKLIDRLSAIDNPVVSTKPSKASLPADANAAHAGE